MHVEMRIKILMIMEFTQVQFDSDVDMTWTTTNNSIQTLQCSNTGCCTLFTIRMQSGSLVQKKKIKKNNFYNNVLK